MLHDVTVSGDVETLGTPVSAYILLYPSDGRCPWSQPWSAGYRSDAGAAMTLHEAVAIPS
jgi:hypothetical protein